MAPRVSPFDARLHQVEALLSELEQRLTNVKKGHAQPLLGLKPKDNDASKRDVPTTGVSSSRRKLKVTVVSADLITLRSSDYCSALDPSCTIKCMGYAHGQTRCVSNDPRPVWNETTYVFDYDFVQPLVFHVYDTDLPILGDDIIAKATLESAQLLDNGFDGKLPLEAIRDVDKEARGAEIHVRVSVEIQCEGERLHKEKRSLGDFLVSLWHLFFVRCACVPLFLVMSVGAQKIHAMNLVYYCTLAAVCAWTVNTQLEMLEKLKTNVGCPVVYEEVHLCLRRNAEDSSFGRLARLLGSSPHRLKLVFYSLLDAVELHTATFSIPSVFKTWSIDPSAQEKWLDSWSQSYGPMSRDTYHLSLPEFFAIVFFVGRTVGLLIFWSHWRKANMKIDAFSNERQSFHYLHSRHTLWRHVNACAVQGGFTAPTKLSRAMVDCICRLGDSHCSPTASGSLVQQPSFGAGNAPTHHTVMVGAHVELSYQITHGLLVIIAGGWFKISMVGSLYYSLEPAQWYTLGVSALLSIVSVARSLPTQLHAIRVLNRHLRTWPTDSHPYQRMQRKWLISFSWAVLAISGVALAALSIRMFGVWWCQSRLLNVSSGCVKFN